jgi:hypothetical protein
MDTYNCVCDLEEMTVNCNTKVCARETELKDSLLIVCESATAWRRGNICFTLSGLSLHNKLNVALGLG